MGRPIGSVNREKPFADALRVALLSGGGRRLRIIAEKLSATAVSMSSRGPVLLFGIGTKALPSWDSKTRRNNLWGGVAVPLLAGE
jgi:hypothetical protein